MKTSYDEKKPIDRLILYIPDKESIFKRTIIIVDREHGNVGIPNSSKGHYALVLNYFLFQSGGADRFVPFSDGGKGWGFDTKIRIGEKEISFKVPPKLEIGEKVLVEIR